MILTHLIQNRSRKGGVSPLLVFSQDLWEIPGGNGTVIGGDLLVLEVLSPGLQRGV